MTTFQQHTRTTHHFSPALMYGMDAYGMWCYPRQQTWTKIIICNETVLPVNLNLYLNFSWASQVCKIYRIFWAILTQQFSTAHSIFNVHKKSMWAGVYYFTIWCHYTANDKKENHKQEEGSVQLQLRYEDCCRSLPHLSDSENACCVSVNDYLY